MTSDERLKQRCRNEIINAYNSKKLSQYAIMVIEKLSNVFDLESGKNYYAQHKQQIYVQKDFPKERYNEINMNRKKVMLCSLEDNLAKLKFKISSENWHYLFDISNNYIPDNISQNAYATFLKEYKVF